MAMNSSFSDVRMTPSSSRLRWTQVWVISVYWFALNFHWSALLTIVLPGQVLMLVGSIHKVDALAFVLIPGAFVSLFANPFWGWMSDLERGPFVRWGRRRPYILLGTLGNVGGLLWMAAARDIMTLTLAYALVQFTSNAAQASFHALLPDIVPARQRGSVSGLMGVLMIGGTIAGVAVAGLLLDATVAPQVYWRASWTVYDIMSVVLLTFMLPTVTLVKEKGVAQFTRECEDERAVPTHFQPSKRSSTRTPVRIIVETGGMVVLAAGVLWLGGRVTGGALGSGSDGQQIILMVIVTMGLLRLCDFRLRRNPDFAWVLLTRLLVSLGIALIQNWVQYYLRDVLRLPHAELFTAQFLTIVALAGLCSAAVAGRLSDHWGRKRLVYGSGGMMALVGIVIVVTQASVHSVAILLPILLGAGILFGLGYGAYQSVDWALIADVLPSRQHYARDMGVWNISLSLPQVLAPAIAGPLITTFARHGQVSAGYQFLFALAATCCLLGTLAIHAIRSVGR